MAELQIPSVQKTALAYDYIHWQTSLSHW